MRRRIKIVMAAALAVLIAAGMPACKKAKLNRQTTSTEDDAKAQQMFDDLLKTTNQGANEAESNSGSNKMQAASSMFQGSCPDISVTPAWPDSTFPKDLVLDFGSDYCAGADGKERKGKITATYTGRYREAGTTITIKPDNYYVDGYKVEGTKTVTNNGNNSSGNLTYTINVEGTITTPEGETVTWESVRTREWVEGQETNFFTLDENNQWMGFDGILDDAYDITGTGNGKNRNDRTYTVNITTPLHVQFCGWVPEVTAGTVELQPEDLHLRTVEFGSGECDNEGEVHIKKKTYGFNMR